MSAFAGRGKRPWWAGTGSVAGSVGLWLVTIGPLLVNAAASEPSRHPTAWVLAIVVAVLVVVLLTRQCGGFVPASAVAAGCGRRRGQVGQRRAAGGGDHRHHRYRVVAGYPIGFAVPDLHGSWHRAVTDGQAQQTPHSVARGNLPGASVCHRDQTPDRGTALTTQMNS